MEDTCPSQVTLAVLLGCNPPSTIREDADIGKGKVRTRPQPGMLGCRRRHSDLQGDWIPLEKPWVGLTQESK